VGASDVGNDGASARRRRRYALEQARRSRLRGGALQPARTRIVTGKTASRAHPGVSAFQPAVPGRAGEVLGAGVTRHGLQVRLARAGAALTVTGERTLARHGPGAAA
jgi:hypothetical protein